MDGLEIEFKLSTDLFVYGDALATATKMHVVTVLNHVPFP